MISPEKTLIHDSAIPISSRSTPAANSEIQELTQSSEIVHSFESLISLPRKKVISQLTAEKSSNKDRIREEVIVQICRLWIDEGHNDDAWRLAGILTSRIRGKVARTLQVWRLDFPPPLRDEIIEEIISRFYETLFDRSEAGKFLSVRFWVSFDCDLLDIVRRRRREQDNQPAFDQAQDSLSSDSEIYTVNPWLDNSLQDPLMRTLISEALAGLPDIIRQAFVLKYYAGYPEESDKHEKGATIASMLNVSGRTVRNYLMRAEEHLARWRDGLVLNPKSSKRSQEYGR